MQITLGGQDLKLLPEKAVWIPSIKSLIIADVHLDKGAHFRKNGIPIPDIEKDGCLKILERLIDQYKPKELIVLGDLIHVDAGEELATFLSITAQIPNCQLVTGNHDLKLHGRIFDYNWTIIAESKFENLVLVHGDRSLPEFGYSLSGHCHPGIRLKLGFQKQEFPAFILQQKRHLIFPAFGKFTGLNTQIVMPEDEVFVVTSGKIWPIPSRN